MLQPPAPNITVIAGVRDPSESWQALQDLPRGKDSRIIVVKIALEATKDIQNQGIRHLNVVIANVHI